MKPRDVLIRLLAAFCFWCACGIQVGMDQFAYGVAFFCFGFAIVLPIYNKFKQEYESKQLGS